MANDLPEGAPVMLRMSIERENGYLSWLGTQLENIEYGSAELSIPFDSRLTDTETDPPTVHNGIIATLMEQTAELAIRTTLPDPVNDTVDPLSLDLNFLYGATDGLEATARVIENTDGAAIASVTVESQTPDDSRESIATGQCVFQLKS